MPSGYKFPILDSSGNPTTTIVDMEDMFVPQDLFLNSGIWTWGSNSLGQLGLNDATSRSSPVQVGSLTNWRLVSGGFNHTAAIKTDGTLWTWGRNNYGALGLNNTTTLSSPVQVGTLANWWQVAGGSYHTAAVKTDGTLWLWGYNNLGQLGLDNITNYSSPVQVGTLTNWRQGCSGFHFCFHNPSNHLLFLERI